MKILFFFLTLAIYFSSAKAAFEKHGNGASNIGLSLSGLASRSPDHSAFTNPAQITGVRSVDFFYRNYFGIKELKRMAIHSEFTVYGMPVGFGFMRYGNDLYSESGFVFGTAYLFNPDLSVGFSITTYFLKIKNYGSAFSSGLNISMLYKINSSFQFAALVSNINEPALGSSGEKIPVSGTIGLSYAPNSEVEIIMDVFKEEFYNFEYRFGTRISVVPGINALAGFQNSINSFSAGLEYNQNSYALKYSVDIHPVLNMSHALGFRYVL